MNLDCLWIISQYLNTPTWGKFRLLNHTFFTIPTKGDIYNRIKHIDWFDAAENDNYSVLKAYIDIGFDLNIQNNGGRTALIKASCQGHTECVKLLINAGADLNIQNNHGSTALSLASCHGRTECVKLLINAGADLNIQKNNGETALIEASYNGRTECVKLLINAGAHLNIQDNYGNTALIWASRCHTECGFLAWSYRMR